MKSKLAAASPSPSKLPQANPVSRSGPLVPYDPAAYTLSWDSGNEDEDEWEDAESEVNYPVLPLIANNNTSSTGDFTLKAKDHSRRESKEFKSIFTTLEHPSRPTTPATLTDVNTKVNVRGAGVIPPYLHPQQQKLLASGVSPSPSSFGNVRNTASAKPSPSTIRRVRSSGVSELVQPFEDTIKTVPHGLPGKKRRRELDDEGDDAKENRRVSTLPRVPGAWDDGHTGEKAVDEGEKRGGKRAKTDPKPISKDVGATAGGRVLKKSNKAREAAARNAKERKGAMDGLGKERGTTAAAGAGEKGRGILSMSRLNMLSRPKERR